MPAFSKDINECLTFEYITIVYFSYINSRQFEIKNTLDYILLKNNVWNTIRFKELPHPQR